MSFNAQLVPRPQGPNYTPLMEIAQQHYTRQEVNRINRYRLYLRVISLYYIITYDGILIHPEIEKGQRVKSRKSRIHWVEFPKPPKKDKGLWIAFFDTHVKPLLEQPPIQWNVNAPPTYHTTFFTSSLDDNLYQHTDEGYRIYSPKPAK
jgi:hypothetical protein